MFQCRHRRQQQWHNGWLLSRIVFAKCSATLRSKSAVANRQSLATLNTHTHTHTQTQDLRGLARQLPGCKGTYAEMWLARAYLMAGMRSSGIDGLSMSNVGIRCASQMAPDQNKWLWRLTNTARGARMTLPQLMSAIGFTKPLELLSCWLCLCGSISAGKVQGREKELQRACAAFEAQHGWRPHPQELVDGLDR